MPNPTGQAGREVLEFTPLDHKHPGYRLDSLQVGNILQHKKLLPANDLNESGYGNNLEQLQVLSLRSQGVTLCISVDRLPLHLWIPQPGNKKIRS